MTVGAVLCIASASCTSSATSTNSTSSLQGGFAAAPNSATFVADYTNWIINGLDSNNVERRVFDLEQQLIAECAQSGGFEYFPLPDPRNVSTGNQRYFDQDYAKQFGFGVVQIWYEQTLLGGGDANDKYQVSLSAAAAAQYQVLMVGQDGVGGCVASAHADALSSLGVNRISVATQETGSQVVADARMEDARAAWRECASRLGHHELDVGTLMSDLTDEFAPIGARAQSPDDQEVKKFRAKEVEIALTLLPCNGSFADVVHQVTLEYANRYLETHPV